MLNAVIDNRYSSNFYMTVFSVYREKLRQLPSLAKWVPHAKYQEAAHNLEGQWQRARRLMCSFVRLWITHWRNHAAPILPAFENFSTKQEVRRNFSSAGCFCWTSLLKGKKYLRQDVKRANLPQGLSVIVGNVEGLNSIVEPIRRWNICTPQSHCMECSIHSCWSVRNTWNTW